MLVQFVLPSALKIEDVPAPNNAEVTVSTVPSKLVAAITFSGWAMDGDMREHAKLLTQYLQRDRHRAKTVDGKPVWRMARYDSPWTPADMRTNEVLMELEGIGATGRL